MCPSTSTLHTLSWYKPSGLVRTKVGWFLSKYLGIPDCYLVRSQTVGTYNTRVGMYNTRVGMRQSTYTLQTLP